MNTLLYTSPLWISLILYEWTSLQGSLDASDTNFTIPWSIATLAAGLILSNLPQSNKWVIKIKKEKGLFVRVSLFLMSPTLYGLFHYSLAKIKDPSDLIKDLTFITYTATILSVLFTALMLCTVIYKLHDDE